MHTKLRRIIPVLLILCGALAFAWWYFGSREALAQSNELVASGTIEATQVTLAPEIGGRVAEVMARQGEHVEAGQILVRLDEALLQAQLQQAQAALEVARASYDLVAAGLADEQRQVAIRAAELELLVAGQVLDELSEKADLASAQARKAIALAEKALEKADDLLEALGGEADPADIEAAEAVVVLAKDKLDKARQDFLPYENKPADNVARAMFQTKLAEAQKTYDAAVTRLNKLGGKAADLDLELALADQALAQAQLDDARRQADKLKDGPNPNQLALAEARQVAAQASLAAAQAGPGAEQLALAEAQVKTAEAAVNALQIQLSKLTLFAPGAGTILERIVEPGEVVLPGASLLILANLEELTITVYVPEDRYGLVQLGQAALVQVDSFPDQEFDAVVIYIADRAEFTPRNVQTPEGRRTTVFAIRLRLENPDGRLKAGMPADVTFGGK